MMTSRVFGSPPILHALASTFSLHQWKPIPHLAITTENRPKVFGIVGTADYSLTTEMKISIQILPNRKPEKKCFYPILIV